MSDPEKISYHIMNTLKLAKQAVKTANVQDLNYISANKVTITKNKVLKHPQLQWKPTDKRENHTHETWQ